MNECVCECVGERVWVFDHWDVAGVFDDFDGCFWLVGVEYVYVCVWYDVVVIVLDGVDW